MSYSDETPEAPVVLIVEDHADLRRIMKEVLEYEGFRALTATDGQEAITLLENLDAEPDLIMSDIIMDDMDGCEFFRWLRQSPRWRHVPFIFVSGKTQVEASCMDLPDGADGFIEKPFTLRDLIDAVSSAVGL